MLDFPTIQQYVADVSYRPEWEMTALDAWWLEGQPAVRVTMNVVNTYHPDQPKLSLNMTQSVPKTVATRSDLYDWLLGVLLWMEEHECQEWFKFQGRPWVDPHEGPYHSYDPEMMSTRARKLRSIKRDEVAMF